MDSRPSVTETNAVSEVLNDEQYFQSEDSPIDLRRLPSESKAKLLSPPPEHAIESLATLITPVRHSSPGAGLNDSAFQFSGILSQLDSKLKNLNDRKKGAPDSLISENPSREEKHNLIKMPSYLKEKPLLQSPKGSNKLDDLFQKLANKRVGSPAFKTIANMGSNQQETIYSHGSSALGLSNNRPRSRSPPVPTRLDLRDYQRSKSGDKDGPNKHSREFERTLKELERKMGQNAEKGRFDAKMREKDDDLSRGLVTSQLLDSHSPMGAHYNQQLLNNARPGFLLDRGHKRPKLISSSREMHPHVNSIHSEVLRDDPFDTRSIDLVSKHSGAGEHGPGLTDFHEYGSGMRPSFLGAIGEGSAHGEYGRRLISRGASRSRSPGAGEGVYPGRGRDLKEVFRAEKAKIERKARMGAEGYAEREGFAQRRTNDTVAVLVPMNQGLDFADNQSPANKFERFSKKAAEITQSLVAQLSNNQIEDRKVSVLDRSLERKSTVTLTRGGNRSKSRSRSPKGDFRRWLQGETNEFAKDERSGGSGSRSPRSGAQRSGLDSLYSKLAERVFHQPSNFVKKRALGAKLNNSKGIASRSPPQNQHKRIITNTLEQRALRL